MECSDALILISGHIDQVNTEQEEAALQAHLADCPACRSLLKAYEDIDSNVAAMEVPAPQNLAPSIMKKLEPRTKQKKHNPWIGVGASAGLVAAVLVLVLGTNAGGLKNLSGSVFNTPQEEYSGDAVTNAGANSNDELGQPEYFAMPEGNKASASEPVAEDADAKVALGTNFRHHTVQEMSAAVIADCEALAEDNTAAVLLYSGLDADFFPWLAQTAPALAARFDTNSRSSVDEATGVITVTADYTTVAALHEWFEDIMLCGAAGVSPEGDLLDEILAQYALYGFDGSHLASIEAVADDFAVEAWPDSWPDDFAERWFYGENWEYFLPKESYIPEGEDLAFLVLIPPAEES